MKACFSGARVARHGRVRTRRLKIVIAAETPSQARVDEALRVFADLILRIRGARVDSSAALRLSVPDGLALEAGRRP